MLNLRGIRAPLLIGVASLGFGCEHDLTLSPPVDPSTAVVAQFDPTNPIPVLTIVPSPTLLAEKAGGGLSVTAQECEKPSQKECLQLVAGWPTTTPITLYFSGDLEEASITEGIKLFEADGDTLTPVMFTATPSPRTPPPDACAEGGNGSAGGYDPATDVPPGNQLVLTPNTPLKPGTQYRLYVESYAEGSAVKGLRDAKGKRVDASSLFSLLNTPPEAPPVTAEGEIKSALLRANVSSAILSALFPTKSLAELSAEEKAQLAAAIKARTQSGLYPLYGFFAENIAKGVAAGVTKRENLIFANTWHTAPATPAPVGGEVLFDPLAQKLPFPNAQLLTSASTVTVQVSIPVNPCGAAPTPGCDSPSAAALKGGLNTLDGFSTTAPITVPFSRDIDPATLAGKVVMYRVNQDGSPGDAVDIKFETKTSSGTANAELRIIPVKPLAQSATYVLAIKKGVKDTGGDDFRRPQLFNFLTVREPLVTEEGEMNPAAQVTLPGAPTLEVRIPLQCAPVAAGQPFPPAAAVIAQATTIETQLRRARWVEALTTLATVQPAIAENDILMAWTHKTQSITKVVDTVQRGLLPTVYQQVRTASGAPAIVGPLTELLTRQQIQGTIAVTLCRSGGVPGIAPADCLVNGQPNPAIFQNALVQALLPAFTAGIGSMRLYAMSTYIATRGNPLGAGGTFTPASIAQPAIKLTPFWVITSTNTTTGPKAPIVVFQHGLGSQKEAGFFIASTFGLSGRATVLMDLPFHGSRASDLVGQNGICATADPLAISCANGMCTGGCDGLQDGSGTGFLSSNVFAARDNFRQATIDQLTLLHVLRTESAMGRPLAYLDGSRIAYAGQSLGGITGGNLAAYAGDLEASVLNVPGGGLVNILLQTVPQISGPLFASLAAAGVCTPIRQGNAVVGCQDTPAFRQFTTIAQWALDPGDPLANSIGITQARPGVPALGTNKVLIQMVVPDKVVPNPTTLALGESYGFTPTDNSATSHFQTYDFSAAASPNLGSGCHAFLLAPTPTCQSDASLTGSVCATFGAQQQAARFIATGGAMIGTRAATLPGICQ